MYQVIQWLKDTAEAVHEKGETPSSGQFAEAMFWGAVESDRGAEYTDERRKLVKERAFDIQMDAFTVLEKNWRQMNGQEFVETMTTAHFADYFSTALSRLFFKDYEYQAGAWVNYTYADTTPDFRDVDRHRMTEPGTLYRRREKAEAKATDISDSHISYGVEEYARQFDVSWQTIVNDDLGKIKETPERMFKAAKRFEDSFVSNLYDNATTQATIAALGAPWSGTGRLTAANLAIGLNAMMQRTDASGIQMNIGRVHLVIPPILKIQAQSVLKDLIQYGAGGVGDILSEYIAGVHVDPYITTAGANVPWYLFADPSEIPAVTVARLSGWTNPAVFMKKSNMETIMGSAPAAILMGSFETGDIEYMVEDVIGGWDDASYVGVTDYRGLYYSSGTTV